MKMSFYFQYLIKFNEIKTKKGIELLQHLVEYYHAQTNYFQDGLKTIEHFGSYVADLSVRLQKIRQQQDEERRRLAELRATLRAAAPPDKEVTHDLILVVSIRASISDLMPKYLHFCHQTYYNNNPMPTFTTKFCAEIFRLLIH